MRPPLFHFQACYFNSATRAIGLTCTHQRKVFPDTAPAVLSWYATKSLL